MTDLINALRSSNDEWQLEAADWIEHLEETTTMLGQRIEQLEAALKSIAKNTCCDKCQEAALVAREALEDRERQGHE